MKGFGPILRLPVMVMVLAGSDLAFSGTGAAAGAGVLVTIRPVDARPAARPGRQERSRRLQAKRLLPHRTETVQACSRRYRPGVKLFAAGKAQASPQALATARGLEAAIKSVSDGRYWGLRHNIRYLPHGGPGTLPALEIVLPKGSINPGNKQAPRGGAGYRWTPSLPEAVRSACLSYWVWFPPDFDFGKGGKLPGLFGGTGPAGGQAVTGRNGFSTRYMWRQKGRGEVYAYIVGAKGRGISLSRGAWRFKKDQWTRLEQEVILNHPARRDGRIRVWVNGRLVLDETGLLFRTNEQTGFRGVMAHVFFGGKDRSWAASRDMVMRYTPFDLRWRTRPALGEAATNREPENQKK